MTASNTRREITSLLLQSTAIEWFTTLGLVFGGCCSNAWALEILTSQNPHAGSLVTFAQFLLVSLYGLRKQLTTSAEDDAREILDRKKLLDNLAKDVITTSPLISVKRADDLRDRTGKLSLELESLDSLDSPGNVFMLVHGGDIPTPPLVAERTYSILLAIYAREEPKTEYYQLKRSLTVDHSDCSVVVSPAPPPSKRRWSPWDTPSTMMRLRFKKRKIPISHWAVQVVLFFISSMLNNAAFGYDVPMSVHIIFRSGGLVVNMLMGWLIGGRKYNITQILSVFLVTAGVACTTLSASNPPPDQVGMASSARSYLTGIVILTLALVISGLMGLSQDKTYARYGRGDWEESMFYLHFLALPGFSLVWRDIVRQVRTVHSSVRVEVGLEIIAVPLRRFLQRESVMGSWPNAWILRHIWKRGIVIPSFYIPLAVNVMTQLLCVSGVNRLTSRVSSLTVTLVLVVRKAVSLGISVVVLRRGQGEGGLLWTGAGLVLVGTIGYTVGTSGRRREGGVRGQRSIAKKEQ
ncbi:UAA-domain-containing protein [Hysterangium stoloniferum]|nr:UAA-domain-containing protein [Hysterangium stoloniferum]